MSADLAELLYQLALAHLGIARIPEFMVVDEVRRGVLVPLLQEYAFPEPIYAIKGEKRLHLEVADIAGELTHPQKRCVPALHLEPQKWEATIPVCKVNRKVNEINDLPTPPPRQC